MKILLILLVICVGCEITIEDPDEDRFELPYEFIKDLPKLNFKPFQDLGDLCKPCVNNSQCSDGGFCVYNFELRELFCSAYCGGEFECPNGFVCIPSMFSDKFTQCFPLDSSVSCEDNLQEEW